MMDKVTQTPAFQSAIEVVEALSFDEQAILIDIIDKRLKQHRRSQLLQEVLEAEENYAQGNVRRGSVADLMAELDD
jgi:hypothetical protein